MPVLIKDFTWRQTEDLVIVRVPLHNIPHHKVDLFTSDIYIKVHYPPFLFESCLYGKINEEESKCSLVEGEAVFTLVKEEKFDWPGLSKEIPKQEMIAIKKQAIDFAHAKATDRMKQKKEERTKRSRACVSEQVRLEGVTRKEVEGRKEAAREAALTDVQRWKEEDTDPTVLPGPIARARARIKATRDSKCGRSKKDEALEKEIFSSAEPKSEECEEGPGIRSSGTIGVTFSYRAFPTPSRESKLEEENQWLKKMAEARRKTGFVAEDLRPEENDPQWLLDKGKRFHEVGNYLGAVSAFTHAIRTWREIPELWVARSSSQLALANYRRVLTDTTEALGLLKPHVSSNEELRYTSHVNRGRALVEIGRPGAALADFEEALLLRPYSEELHHCMDWAESVLSQQREAEQSKATTPCPPPDQNFLEPEDLAT